MTGMTYDVDPSPFANKGLLIEGFTGSNGAAAGLIDDVDQND
jgi:hypothetical protein